MATDNQTQRQRSKNRPEVKNPFTIDGRIQVSIDFDLALDLADLILGTDEDNSAMLALAHALKKLDKSKE